MTKPAPLLLLVSTLGFEVRDHDLVIVEDDLARLETLASVFPTECIGELAIRLEDQLFAPCIGEGAKPAVAATSKGHRLFDEDIAITDDFNLYTNQIGSRLV
jgi:hypothetical protein